MTDEESTRQKPCPACGIAIAENARYCKECLWSPGDCTAEEWSAMFQRILKRSVESMGHLADFSRTEIDDGLGWGMQESQARFAICGEVDYAQDLHDAASSCTPEDSALAPAHSALLKYLVQHGAVMRALLHQWECQRSAERSGHDLSEDHTFLAARSQVKDAAAVLKTVRDEFFQLLQDLSKNDRKLCNRVNVRRDDE